MDITGSNFSLSHLNLNASESLFQKETLVQKDGNSIHQKTSKYKMNLSLDMEQLNVSNNILPSSGYSNLKSLLAQGNDSNFSKIVTDQIDKLYQTDPKLAKKYIVLMEFLEENDPKAAKELSKRMETALKLRDAHNKAFNDISDKITNIANKIQNSNRRDLQTIAERTNIHIDVKLEITENEKSANISKNSQDISSYMKNIKLKMAIDIRVEHEKQKQADPLIIDLNGDGFNLKNTDKGIMFDINGDGKKELTSWISGDDAFLALDRNLNGKIDNGKELFGDQNGMENGFLELSKLDQDKNGILNFKDPMFSKLLLFKDINGNGETNEGELIPLSKAGISSINLNYAKFNLSFRKAMLLSLIHI